MLVPFCESGTDKVTTLQWTAAFLGYIKKTCGDAGFQTAFAEGKGRFLESSSSSSPDPIHREMDEILSIPLADFPAADAPWQAVVSQIPGGPWCPVRPALPDSPGSPGSPGDPSRPSLTIPSAPGEPEGRRRGMSGSGPVYSFAKGSLIALLTNTTCRADGHVSSSVHIATGSSLHTSGTRVSEFSRLARVPRRSAETRMPDGADDSGLPRSPRRAGATHHPGGQRSPEVRRQLGDLVCAVEKTPEGQ
ncbi:Transcription factor-like 5 protein [Liparis tanakae]|uniref:Transcription factor-like 5 protein n=1 Tax=Liparis tanakae TaxID=230148 RepID=A0A4Z2FI47_9TELE|nr:Transcription factor-like 5 protein [Liparis tanakae]